MTEHTAPRKYKPSRKRTATSEQVRQRIKESAWAVFGRQGLDGATISEIVLESGVSTGSFYNYFGTKQAVFDELIGDLANSVRDITAAARAKADSLDMMLQYSYQALLDFIKTIEGCPEFTARNQHHLRVTLYGEGSTGGLLADIRQDVVRGLPGRTLTPLEVTLVSRLIIANGIETLLIMDDADGGDTAQLAQVMTRMIMNGINDMGRSF